VFATLDVTSIKSVFDFPVPKGWEWEDAEGWEHSEWEYAFNFRGVNPTDEATWGTEMTPHSYVRRRKWSRTLVSLKDSDADDSNVYELYIEAEWHSKAHLEFEHAMIKASLDEVYAKLNILLIFEFKRLDTGDDAKLSTLQVPNLEKLTMALVKTPTFSFKILTRTGDLMAMPGADYLNKTFVEDLVFNLFPMCFYDLNFVFNQEKDLDQKYQNALETVRAVRGYLLLALVEGRWAHSQTNTKTDEAGGVADEHGTPKKHGKIGHWYAVLVGSRGQDSWKVAETHRISVDKFGDVAYWCQTFPIPVVKFSRRGTPGGLPRATSQPPTYGIELRRQPTNKGREMAREVLWSDELDLGEEASGIAKLSSPFWLNPASPAGAATRLLSPTHADSSIRTVVREIGLDMRPLEGLAVGTTLSRWAGETEITGGVLMVTPIGCDGLAERKWVRLRMTLCVGENRKEALETRWSSRVYADYSRDKPNVVNRKFTPVWPKGEVVAFTRLGEPCRRLRLCVEVMTCAAPGAGLELQQEQEANTANKKKSPSATSVSSPAPAATQTQLVNELITETCEGVLWLTLGSLVAIDGSFTPPTPAPAPPPKEANAPKNSDNTGSGQQAGGGEMDHRRGAAAAGGAEEEAGVASGGGEEGQGGQGLVFVTPRDALKQKLPDSVKKDAWYNKFCSVMLAYRPDRVSAGPARIVIRLHSIRLPLAAQKVPSTRIRFNVGPDAQRDVGQLSRSWTSGTPMLQSSRTSQQAGATSLSPPLSTFAFRSQCVASLEVAGRTVQEQGASSLAVRLESVGGKGKDKDVASTVVTMAGVCVCVCVCARACEVASTSLTMAGVCVCVCVCVCACVCVCWEGGLQTGVGMWWGESNDRASLSLCLSRSLPPSLALALSLCSRTCHAFTPLVPRSILRLSVFKVPRSLGGPRGLANLNHHTRRPC
jgi:hypothetical protein